MLTGAPRLRAGWLAGLVPDGIVVADPEREIELAVAPGERRTALWAAVAGGEPERAAAVLAGIDADELGALLDRLVAMGARGDAPVPPEGRSLAAAIARVRDGRHPGLVWTAEEALVLPPDLSLRVAANAIRAFVGGLVPDGRLQAYALLASGHGAVAGDVPTPGAVRERLAALDGDPAAISVADLHGPALATVAPAELARIGALRPHRLGPIARMAPPVPFGADGRWLCVAEVAAGNLAAPGGRGTRLVQGVGSREHARLVASAEGAERFASADLSAADITWARPGELPGAISPAVLYARSSGEDGGDAERPWCAVHTAAGVPRWVPAETVYTSVAHPAATIPWTSSGLAAHPDPVSARQRALQELVERDAFMWTWLRRVSRERIRPADAPADTRALADLLAADGWATTWVNLTLDTYPVVLCCTTHERAGLTLGAACDPDPAAALVRATEEAAVLALGIDGEAEPRPAPRDVRTPRDHVLLHRDPARAADHGFLFAGAEEIALAAVPSGAGVDLAERLAVLGHTPLFADLTIPACRPFHVVRALAPGLVPLAFGWGNEPLGLPRLRGAVGTGDGRQLENGVVPCEARGRLPHPFP